MLISHLKKFIFLKSRKTAGTSVEIYFERFCIPETDYRISDERPRESVTSHGIVAPRGVKISLSDHEKLLNSNSWTEHMWAFDIRKKIGQHLWDEYHKFSIVRNPFDKVISSFWFAKHISTKFDTLSQQEETIRFFVKHKDYDIVEQFRLYVRKRLPLSPAFNDINVYSIDGRFVADSFLRYENLHEGIMCICSTLDIPYEPERLLRFKSDIRDNTVLPRDLYDEKTRSVVANLFALELKSFEYEFPY